MAEAEAVSKTMAIAICPAIRTEWKRLLETLPEAFLRGRLHDFADFRIGELQCRKETEENAGDDS